ncbi:hypothetical protein J8J42_11870 [Chryseobacterium sp. cx-311]|uniref:hypothetical protein n=1 Tax=Marnyiella aurantia TaxID=2758037 RepID=UPI001AE5F072|nr:hypothetical protein [Marnyiella aurantia]MBP0613735.1 hypothetical protein [Marnyiella aurantia]
MKGIFTIVLFLFFLKSCDENKNTDFIELSSGFNMNPAEPRFGIIYKPDNNIYYCTEIMKNKNSTGKYKYFISESRIDFVEYKTLMNENFRKNYIPPFKPIVDATIFQIKYQFNNEVDKVRFYPEQLNEKQLMIFEMMKNLKDNGKFKEIDSITFSKDLLQYKLPEPPKL